MSIAANGCSKWPLDPELWKTKTWNQDKKVASVLFCLIRLNNMIDLDWTVAIKMSYLILSGRVISTSSPWFLLTKVLSYFWSSFPSTFWRLLCLPGLAVLFPSSQGRCPFEEASDQTTKTAVRNKQQEVCLKIPRWKIPTLWNSGKLFCLEFA